MPSKFEKITALCTVPAGLKIIYFEKQNNDYIIICKESTPNIINERETPYVMLKIYNCIEIEIEIEIEMEIPKKYEMNIEKNGKMISKEEYILTDMEMYKVQENRYELHMLLFRLKRRRDIIYENTTYEDDFNIDEKDKEYKYVTLSCDDIDYNNKYNLNP